MTSEARKDNVIKTLRSLLISVKDSLTLQQCNRDYKETEGEPIPFRELGFKTLEELFKSIPGFKVTTDPMGQVFVDAKVSEEAKHIARLIATQKTKSKAKGKAGPPTRSFREKNIPRYGPPKLKPSPYNYKNNISLVPPRFTKVNNTNTNSTPSTYTPNMGFTKPNNDLTANNSAPAQNIQSNNKVVNNVVKENGKSGAAARLSKLQNNFKTESLVNVTKPAPQPVNNQEAAPKNAQEELIKHCRDNNLPEPIYKFAEIIAKRGPISYDCSLKVGKFSFNTYPNSLASKELAAEKVSNMALEDLRKVNTENGVKLLNDPKQIVEKITELMTSYSSGLFVKNVPDQFRNQYKEQLPDNWLSLVRSCKDISIEQGACGSEILWYTEKSKSDEPTFAPPPLEYPKEDWPVYIMEVFSPLEVWLRIIGPEYSDEYDNLLNDMFEYFNKNKTPCEFLVKDRFYCVLLNEDYYRCRILSIDHREDVATCFFIDLGIEESYPIKSFYELPQQFLKLAAQAIPCCLEGLQEYSFLDVKPLQNMLVAKAFRCEIIESPDEGSDTFTIDLFDTSTAENIKVSEAYLKQIFSQIQTPKLLPNCLNKVYVVEVKNSDNIIVQIRDENWKFMESMLNNFVLTNLSSLSSQPITAIKPRSICIAKSSKGEWVRAEMISREPDASGMVSVKYIDWHYEEKISINNVFPLETVCKELAMFPPQTLRVALDFLHRLNSQLVAGLRQLILHNETVVCKLVKGNLVRMFVRIQPQNIIVCVNDTYKIESEFDDIRIKTPSPTKDESNDKQREKKSPIAKTNSTNSIQDAAALTSGKINQFPVPKEGSTFDIKIINPVSPQNFIVQPLIHEVDLDDMMSNLQIYYKTFSEIPPGIDIGSVYAAYHNKMQCWCRATVTRKFSNGSYVVHFIDFGEYLLVDVDKIRKLPKNFMVLPALAIKAELHGVSPKNSNWRVDDCMQFEKLVHKKRFIAIIKKITYDEHHPEEMLVIMDIKTKTPTGDVFLHKMLENEGICIKN